MEPRIVMGNQALICGFMNEMKILALCFGVLVKRFMFPKEVFCILRITVFIKAVIPNDERRKGLVFLTPG